MSIELSMYVEREVYTNVEEGSFSFNGDVYVEFEHDQTFDTDELVDQLSDMEEAELREALGTEDTPANLQEWDVNVIYENLTDAQCAILFNKLLKYKRYNPKGTSVLRLQAAADVCIFEQDVDKEV